MLFAKRCHGEFKRLLFGAALAVSVSQKRPCGLLKLRAAADDLGGGAGHAGGLGSGIQWVGAKNGPVHGDVDGDHASSIWHQ